jgi:hypothetical protein
MLGVIIGRVTINKLINTNNNNTGPSKNYAAK